MQRQLTVKQENAIDMFVVGATDSEVAQAVGVNRVTVSRWRLYNPQFQAELNRRRQAIWGSSVDKLRALLPRAVDALEAELDGGRHRVRAAVSILQLAGLDRSGPKKAALDRGRSAAKQPRMKGVVETLLIPQADYLALAVPHPVHGRSPYDVAINLVQAMYGRGIPQQHVEGIMIIGY